MMISSTAEFCMQHDADLALLRAAWLAGGSMRQFRVAFTRLVEVAAQLAVSRILLEIDNLPDIPVYDQLWLTASFMPAVLKLPLKRVVVVLSEQQVYNQHVAEGLLMAVSRFMRFDVQFFAHAEPSLAWLTDDSPRLPHLLMEWRAEGGSFTNRPDEVAEPRAPYGA